MLLVEIMKVELKLLYNILIWIGSKIILLNLTPALHTLGGIMTKRFAVGFTAGIIIFLLINLFAAHLASDCGLPAVFGKDSCADDVVRVGWPFIYYKDGGFAYQHILNTSVLLLNLTVALAFGLLSGWLVSRIKTPLFK